MKRGGAKFGANYLRVLPLNLLTGTPASSIVVVVVALLCFRNVLFGVGAGSCSSWVTSSASVAAEVLSADCGREAVAKAGITGSEAGEAGFGVCVLRFLRTGASSN